MSSGFEATWAKSLGGLGSYHRLPFPHQQNEESAPFSDSPVGLICYMLHFLLQKEFPENLQVIEWIYVTYIFMCISVSLYKPEVIYLGPMPVSCNESFLYCSKQVLDPPNPRMSPWNWVILYLEYFLSKTSFRNKRHVHQFSLETESMLLSSFTSSEGCIQLLLWLYELQK